jgi:hypothetical protein
LRVHCHNQSGVFYKQRGHSGLLSCIRLSRGNVRQLTGAQRVL